MAALLRITLGASLFFLATTTAAENCNTTDGVGYNGLDLNISGSTKGVCVHARVGTAGWHSI